MYSAEIGREIDLTAAHLLIHTRSLIDDQAGKDEGWHQHCKCDDNKGDGHRAIAMSRPTSQQPLENRLKQQRRQSGPQKRSGKAGNDKGKQDCRARQEQAKAPIFEMRFIQCQFDLT